MRAIRTIATLYTVYYICVRNPQITGHKSGHLQYIYDTKLIPIFTFVNPVDLALEGT